MAKPPAPGSDKKKSSFPMLEIVAVLLISLIGGGGGFALGQWRNYQMQQQQPTAEAPTTAATVADAKPAEDKAVLEKTMSVRKLPAIVTNLLQPSQNWIRLEVSLIITKQGEHEQDMIAVDASDRIVALLRSMRLTQLEGPSGFLHLRQDLNDLLKQSSDGKIAEVLINSMVVE